MPWFVLPFVLFAALVIVALATFNALVRREQVEHVDAWMADGRPRGYGLPLPGSAPNMVGVWWLTFRWVFRTPAWTRTDPQATRLLRRYRAAVVGAWVVWLALAVTLGS